MKEECRSLRIALTITSKNPAHIVNVSQFETYFSAKNVPHFEARFLLKSG